MKRAPKKYLNDDLYLQTIREMVQQFKTDAEIAKSFESRLDMRVSDRFVTSYHIAGIRNRHDIPAGVELARKARAMANAQRRRELEAKRKDLADRVAAAMPIIDQHIDEGYGDLAIARIVDLNVYHIRNRRADRGLPSLNADKAPRDIEAEYRRNLDEWDAEFAQAIKATGRDFSGNVHTKAFGKPPRLASAGHVVTQSTAGSCADAA